MDNNEECSAFSFKLAKQIEEFINNEVGNIKERNQLLEAKILHFRQELNKSTESERIRAKQEEIDTPFEYILFRYDKFFEITSKKEGKI